MPITDPVACARTLAALIDSEAASTDATGTMTQPVVAALAEAGMFGLLVPRSLDGTEADASTTLAVFEELSRADGSTGWSFLANATTTAFAAAYTGDRAIKEMFGGPTMPITPGCSVLGARPRPSKEGFSSTAGSVSPAGPDTPAGSARERW